MAISQNTIDVLNYMKSVEDGRKVTVYDVAEALGVNWRSVNGAFNSFVKKGLGYREKGEVQTEEGLHKAVSFLYLTEEGKNFTFDEPVAVEE